MKVATVLSFTNVLFFVSASDFQTRTQAVETEGKGRDDLPTPEFYCDDSANALDFVPAERSCTNIGGQQRCWFTYSPDTFGDQPVHVGTVPLVLDLHGFSGCASINPTYTGWREVAKEENFYIVWPQGTNNIFFSPIPCWNAGTCCCVPVRDIPDSDFIYRVIQDTIEANPNVDPNRVYIAGHSNGCFMSQRFVKDYPGVVAAVACHAGVMLLDHPSVDDPSWVPTTIVTVHGDADDVVQYPTNTSDFDVGAEDNIDLWGASNGCTKKTIATDPSNKFITHTWTGCNRGVSTQLYQLPGADHSPYASNGYVNTTALAWDYIKSYSLYPKCPGGQVYTTLEILTDEKPSDISWTVARGSTTNIILEEDNLTEENFKYTYGGYCVRPIDCYIVTIYDSSGDGLNGDGGYALYTDGNLFYESSFQ